MRFAPTGDQIEFRTAVRELLADRCSPDSVRAGWRTDLAGTGVGDGRNDGAWRALADMGVQSLMIPEQFGGFGLTDEDLVPLLIEAGYAGLGEPLGVTAGVAVAAIAGSGDSRSSESMASVADGSARIAAGFGAHPLVGSAESADLLLLVCDSEVHLVAASATTLTPEDSVDGGRGLCRVAWSAGAATCVSADPDVAVAAFDRAAVTSAARLIGLSRRMLDMTVAYVSAREQFAVPIGSFQAVKHRLADAASGIEFAEPLVLHAAHALAHDDGVRFAASMAKARASTAAMQMADAALQCHGAIGYTVEYDLQLFMKQTWVVAREFGDARWHRRRVREALFPA